MTSSLHRVLDRFLETPGILHWRMRQHDAGFASGRFGGFRGVYRNHDEAAAAAPASLPLGYDNEAMASTYRDRISRVWPADYPMMLWLDKIFRQGIRQVADLGGHVGISYYAYQKYIDYPQNLRWQVIDVPAVADAGRKLAAEIDERRAISFGHDFAAISGSELLFTSGCIQYLPETLAERLATLQHPPQWILISMLPLHDTDDYWTVQSLFKAFCPYHIQCKSKFFDDMKAAGYEVVDVWENAEKRCDIAFDPAHSLKSYYGAAFRLSSTPH